MFVGGAGVEVYVRAALVEPCVEKHKVGKLGILG
jgi:hypothetical protein